ncbi:MAG: hypothetical protein M3273_03265 [Actinomycetota bacterium]|nr:hypothetical protein [Actinomycetota bacterium]
MDEGFARALAWHLRPFRRAAPQTQSFPVDMYVAQADEGSDPPVYSLFVRNELHYRGPDLADLTGHAIWDLHALVPKHARDFVFLHAGAVSKNGRALLLPARMDAGKSSLTAALLTAGWGYLSDELGAIDPVTGRIYPFPKLISLDESTMRFLPRLDGARGNAPTALNERFLSAADLGAEDAGPSEPRWIVFPTPDWQGPPRLEPLTSAGAVEKMAENCFNLYRYGDRGIVLLSRVGAGAETFVLRGGTPSERAELLTDELV